MQKSPVVAAVQVRVPHTQLSALANDPSVTVHGANALHRLIARWQCGSAVVHSAEPQEQSPERYVQAQAIVRRVRLLPERQARVKPEIGRDGR